MKPQLLVVVDTEEEFDWNAEPSSTANSVEAVAQLHLAQSVFDEYGIRPCYVVDYPIVAEPNGAQIIRAMLDRGGCEVGAHLHPWVNPPIEEEISRPNTYPGNLSEDLERRKLIVLTELITESIGLRPTVYKAGRYGLGPRSMSLIRALGYEVDVSICPTLDSTWDGGPDYRKSHAFPAWVENQAILQIPLSGAFVGRIKRYQAEIYNIAAKLGAMRVPAVLSRTRLLDRLILSPEGFSSSEHKTLTNQMLLDGHRVFTWSFHSPSLLPGCTPYVHNKAELTEFIARFRRYFDFFLSDLGGEFTTPSRLKRKIEEMT